MYNSAVTQVKPIAERHTDFASQYDFCLVFPDENGGFSSKGQEFIHYLKKLDFEMFAFSGNKSDKEIYVLVRAPLIKLRAFADKTDFPMKLDPYVIKEMLERGDPEANIAPVFIENMPNITPLSPFELIYSKYSRNASESLYWREPGSKHPFRESVRLKLSALLLESRDADGSPDLNLHKYLRKQWLLGYFPLHNDTQKRQLAAEWAHYPRRQLPLFGIKEYFGEKIALYFAFVQHFTEALIAPSIVGLPIQIAVWVIDDPSGEKCE